MVGSFLTSWVNRDYSPIGLDIGHEAIKLLQLRRRGGQWQVSACGLYLFGGEVAENPALRRRQAAQAIDSLLSNAGGRGQFRGRRVVACLNHEQAVIKNARLPMMPPAELAEAVRWEAAERFPFDVDSGLVRFVTAGEVRQGGEQRQEVLMFAASEQTLRDCLRMLDEIGCTPVGLDAQPVALARASSFFLPDDADNASGAQAVADLGGRSCQLLIMRQGRLAFIKTIEIGTQDLNRAIVEKVGTSPDDAATLRMRLGRPEDFPADPNGALGEDRKVHRAVTAAIRPVVERLAHEIVLCLRYYSVTFRGERPGLVTCVGGGSHDSLLMSLLGEALQVKVATGRPLALCRPDEFVCQWGGGPEAGGPEWAVALGCCLKPSRGQSPRPPVDADWVGEVVGQTAASDSVEPPAITATRET